MLTVTRVRITLTNSSSDTRFWRIIGSDDRLTSIVKAFFAMGLCMLVFVSCQVG